MPLYRTDYYRVGGTDVPLTDGGTGASDASGARANLGLGTAAVATIGTSGDTVPKNNTANTFSAAQIITLASASALPLSLVSTEAGAGVGPICEVFRDSASPANSDDIGAFRISGRDDGGNKITAVEFRGQLLDVAAASKDTGLQLYIYTGNNQTREIQVRDGTLLGAATGGHKGTGTVNAVGVYDDNSLLTDLVEEWVATGTVDVEKWDATVPDQVIPEAVRREPVTRKVERMVVRRSRDGDYSAAVEAVDEPVIDLIPVWDADGNGITAVEEQQTREVVTPARTVPRQHAMARRFKALVDDGFDPRDPAAYVARLRKDRALPGNVTAAEWEHNRLSIGESHNHLTLATEILATAFAALTEQHAALLARVEALETARPRR